MADFNNEKINNEKNTSSYSSGTVWEGNSYHGYTPPSGTQYTYSTGSSESYHYTPSENNQTQYSSYGSSYGSSYSPYPSERPRKPKKERKGIFKKVLVGVLACLVVSAGSIAGFAWLINSGVIRIQQSGSGPAFTIVKNSSNGTVSATNTEVTTGELTKQQVAEKVLPSVVCIENYGAASQQSTRRNSDRYGFGDEEDEDDYLDGSDGTAGRDVSPTSEGSGIIMSSDGYIITNAHVVSGAKSLKVVAYDGKTYSAKLIGSDSITDLALIKVDATGLKAAEFGSSSDMKVADTVMAIGNPGGLEFNSSVTVGYVSALNREITSSDTGYTMKCIQTDAAINPGNSGGALVNMHGQVIGINSSKIVATGYEGLGFAIPIDTAQPIITQLKDYGYVKDRAMLGITGTYIDPMTARFYGLDSGLYVSSITSEYISAAGIQRSDVITKIDGKAITSMNSVTTAIASKKPGDTVTLTVSRASTGKTFTAEVKLTQATGKS
jgi:serine protease Do